jgi:hypothetical protein
MSRTTTEKPISFPTANVGTRQFLQHWVVREIETEWWPTTSVRLNPKMVSAPGFQLVITPRRT